MPTRKISYATKSRKLILHYVSVQIFERYIKPPYEIWNIQLSYDNLPSPLKNVFSSSKDTPDPSSTTDKPTDGTTPTPTTATTEESTTPRE